MWDKEDIFMSWENKQIKFQYKDQTKESQENTSNAIT